MMSIVLELPRREIELDTCNRITKIHFIETGKYVQIHRIVYENRNK